MKLSLSTWNGLNINDNNPYQAYILPSQLTNLSKNPILVNRSGDYPHLSGVVKNNKVLVIGVIIGAGQNINTYREALKKYFFSDDNPHALVAIDQSDSDRQYYVTGIPTLLVQESDKAPNSFYITITLDYPYWQQVTATADSWDVTATGDSDVINNVGNINVAPIFTITPLSLKTSGLQYRRYVPIVNVLNKSYEVPLEIAQGNINPQSLIDANKLQPDGDDLRVWNNGGFIDYWTGGSIDSGDTSINVWSNISLSPKQYGTFSTFDSDDTILSFTQTRANLKFLQSIRFLFNRTLKIDSDSDNDAEYITYQDSDIDTVQYQITNVQRGQKDSTAVNHISNGTVRHIDNDLFILYGDSDLSAPDIDNNYKPLFGMDLSTNQKWNWTTGDGFLDQDTNRPGGWYPEVQSSRTGLSYNYTDSDNTFIDPATNMGLALIGSEDFQVQNESGTLDWNFYHPASVTGITYDGNKYSTGSWPAIVGLQYLQPNTVWFTSVNEIIPSTLFTWEYFSNHSADSDVITIGGYDTIRFAIDGLLSSSIGEAALIDFFAYWVSFDSDNVPVIDMNAETSIVFFDLTLKNNTTGEYIKVQAPCSLSQSLTIDCDAKEAYLSDGSPVKVLLSSNRDTWLDLQPGNNSLEFDDTGTTHNNIVITHRDKNL